MQTFCSNMLISAELRPQWQHNHFIVYFDTFSGQQSPNLAASTEIPIFVVI